MESIIDASGLTPLKKFIPQVGVTYWFGASSSPKPVHVIEVTDKWVTYFSNTIYANSKSRKESLSTFGHLCVTGTNTRIKTLQVCAEQGWVSKYPELIQTYLSEADELQNALSGNGETKPIEEHFKYTVYVTFSTPQDMKVWSDINNAIGYSACDGCNIEHTRFDCDAYGKKAMKELISTIKAMYPEATTTIARPKY